MDKESDVTFPWRDFSLWLGEGVLAATIVNKFMVAACPESQRPQKQALDVQPEERELLRLAREQVDVTHRPSIETACNVLADASVYPAIPESDITLLWDALSEYGIKNEHFNLMKDELTCSSGQEIMFRIWRSLGPAIADPSMIGDETAS